MSNDKTTKPWERQRDEHGEDLVAPGDARLVLGELEEAFGG